MTREEEVKNGSPIHGLLPTYTQLFLERHLIDQFQLRNEIFKYAWHWERELKIALRKLKIDLKQSLMGHRDRVSLPHPLLFKTVQFNGRAIARIPLSFPHSSQSYNGRYRHLTISTALFLRAIVTQLRVCEK